VHLFIIHWGIKEECNLVISKEDFSVWSIIKFKVKEENIDDFLEVKILKFPKENFKSGSLIKIDERDFANIIEYENMEKLLTIKMKVWGGKIVSNIYLNVMVIAEQKLVRF
jgi:hypothetical protein